MRNGLWMKGLVLGIIFLFIGAGTVLGDIDSRTNDDITDYAQRSTVQNNSPPSKPILDGPSEVKRGEHFYIFVQSTDPDGDDVYYKSYYQESSKSKIAITIYGPYHSGEIQQIGSFAFIAPPYNTHPGHITIYAIDVYNASSEPSIFATTVDYSIFGTTVSTSTQKIESTDDVFPGGNFGLQSVIFIDWDPNQTYDPLPPDGTPRLINLNVSYTTAHGLFFYRMILLYYRLTRQMINVNLELENIPSWCTATLLNNKIPFFITDTQDTRHTLLAVAVDENAPAFEPFPITIHASVDSMIGPFGFLPFVYGFEMDAEIYFAAGYHPFINVTPEYYKIETTPGAPPVTDPITVENLGNGETLVNINIVSVPEDWNFLISPPQLIIDVNECKITNLTIEPPWDFYGIGIITLSFTPSFYPWHGAEGEPRIVSIIVEVKP